MNTAPRRVMSAYLKKMPVDVQEAAGHPTCKFPVAAEMLFILSARPLCNTKSLFFEARADGSVVRCIKNLYGSYSVEKN